MGGMNAVTAMCVVLCATWLIEAGALRGRVVDGAGTAVPNALVWLESAKKGRVTDSTGAFSFANLLTSVSTGSPVAGAAQSGDIGVYGIDGRTARIGTRRHARSSVLIRCDRKHQVTPVLFVGNRESARGQADRLVLAGSAKRKAVDVLRVMKIGYGLKRVDIAIMDADIGPVALAAETSPGARKAGEGLILGCGDTESTIKSRGVVGITVGTTSFYAGYRQVTDKNQDPVVARFNNGVRTWCRNDYETAGDDGRAYGIYWNGVDTLIGVFSAGGTQGTPAIDYRRFCTAGWLTSYGDGAGGKAAIVIQLNPEDGQGIRGTFVSAKLSSGNTNQAIVTDIGRLDGAVILEINPKAYPRNTDKTMMNCPAYPGTWVLVLSADFSRALYSGAINCDGH